MIRQRGFFLPGATPTLTVLKFARMNPGQHRVFVHGEAIADVANGVGHKLARPVVMARFSPVTQPTRGRDRNRPVTFAFEMRTKKPRGDGSVGRVKSLLNVVTSLGPVTYPRVCSPWPDAGLFNARAVTIIFCR